VYTGAEPDATAVTTGGGGGFGLTEAHDAEAGTMATEAATSTTPTLVRNA
jgi:hypothetical protein